MQPKHLLLSLIPAKWLLIFCLGLVCSRASASELEITVQGLFKDKALLVIGTRQRLLRTGEVSPEGVRLISADSEAAVIKYRGKQATYPLGNRIDAGFAPPARQSVTVYPDRQGMYLVNGHIDGWPVEFLVDTGATTIAMNASAARRLGIDYLVEGEPVMVTTASGVAVGYEVRLRRVSVGQIHLANIRAIVNDNDSYPRKILLGMSFLEHLGMRREGKALQLQKKY